MNFRLIMPFSLLATSLAIGGIMSADSKENKYTLDDLDKSKIPDKFELRAGDFGLFKEGDKAYYKEQSTLISTMDGEPTPNKPPKEELNSKTVEKLWETIRSFDFSSYKKLKEQDLREDEAAASMSDAEFVWPLELKVSGINLISRDFGLMKPKYAELEKKMHRFNERLNQIVHSPRAQRIMKNIGVPKNLFFQYRYDVYLRRTDGKTIINIRIPLEGDGSKLRIKVDELKQLSEKSSRLNAAPSSFMVELSEDEFSKLWKEIKQIDLDRFINISEDDFEFQKPKYTTGFALHVEDNIVVQWRYTDRKMKESIAKPLLKINRLLEDKFYSVVEDIRKK